MKKNVLMIFALLVCVVSKVLGSPVDRAEALSKAKEFMQARGFEVSEDLRMVQSTTVLNHSSSTSVPAYYVFNNGNDKGFVIVANHMSFLDIPVFWPTIGNAAFVAKAALWKAPVFGWVLDSIGCIPVHKNPRKNADMGKLIRDRIDHNYNIVIFPEGHRSADGKLLPFQNGIFKMAKENGLPLVPVTLVGTGKCLSKVKWAMNPGEVRIIVHPLQASESYADKTAVQLRDEIHDIIEKDLKEA